MKNPTDAGGRNSLTARPQGPAREPAEIGDNGEPDLCEGSNAPTEGALC